MIDLTDVANVTEEPIKNSLELSQCLQRHRDGDRQLLILESVGSKYVEVIGEYFRMDTSVSARHQGQHFGNLGTGEEIPLHLHPQVIAV